jgi:predicted Zn-dependent peptidase
MVLLRAVVRAGSWYEGETWGNLHLMEHMLHHGSEMFSDKEEFERYKEQYGMTQNAWTGPSNMGVWVSVPETYIKEGVTLLKQLLFQPKFDEKELEKEKRVIAQEYKDKWSNPYTRFGKEVDKLLYGETIYSRDAMGKPEFFEKTSIETIKKLHEQYFQPQNMVIAAVGGVQSEEVIELLTDAVKERENNPTEKTEEVNPTISVSKTRLLQHQEAVEQVKINLMWTNPGKKEFDMRKRQTLRVGSYLLGGSSRSPLYKKLREEKGYVYSAGTSTWNLPTYGGFVAYASTGPDKAQETIEEMHNVVTEFLKSGVSEDEFKRAINFGKMRALTSYSSVSGIAEDMTDSYFYLGKYYTPEDFAEMLDDISQEEMMDILRKNITDEVLHISVLSKEPLTIPTSMMNRVSPPLEKNP